MRVGRPAWYGRKQWAGPRVSRCERCIIQHSQGVLSALYYKPLAGHAMPMMGGVQGGQGPKIGAAGSVHRDSSVDKDTTSGSNIQHMCNQCTAINQNSPACPSSATATWHAQLPSNGPSCQECTPCKPCFGMIYRHMCGSTPLCQTDCCKLDTLKDSSVAYKVFSSDSNKKAGRCPYHHLRLSSRLAEGRPFRPSVVVRGQI